MTKTISTFAAIVLAGMSFGHTARAAQQMAIEMGSTEVNDSSIPDAPAAVLGGVLINEVYGGGGNAGAPFNQDFVELFNNGVTAVDISGYMIQYASATGTLATIGTVSPSTMLAAGAYYTIAFGPVGGIGSALPGVDQTGGSTNLSATAGKVQLLNASSVVLDLVGYGATANQSETSPAPAPSNTTSIQRVPNGIDTDANAVDFKALAPTPDAFNTLAIPEPTTAALLGIGLLVSAQRFIRRRRS